MASANLGRVKPIYRGGYDSSFTYKPLDFVRFGSTLYICKLQSTGNEPTNESFFDRVSESGSATPEPNRVVKSREDGTIDPAWLGDSVASIASVTWDMENDVYSGNPHATAAHTAMRRCVVDNTGRVVYYLNEYDSTLKEDGTAADLSGASGQVMVEVPQVYVRTTFDGVNKVTWELSPTPVAGLELHPAFDNGVILKQFVGAYFATVYSETEGKVINGLNLDDNRSRVTQSTDKLYSASGNYPMVGLTRAEFRKLAQNGGYQMYDYQQWQLVQMLFITEFGNWNSQEVLGDGNVSGRYEPSSELQEDSPHLINGLSNSLGNHSGQIGSMVCYRGIENPWGNAWQFIDGVNVEDLQLYVSNDEGTYADDIKTGEYSALGSPMPIASNSPIKSWQKVQNAFIPGVVSDGASIATFVGDALWSSETGWRTLPVGGYASDALSAGLSCCAAVTAASVRGRIRSSRLSKKLRSE